MRTAAPLLGQTNTPEDSLSFLTQKGTYATLLAGIGSDIDGAERGAQGNRVKSYVDEAFSGLIRSSNAFGRAMEKVKYSGPSKIDGPALVAAENTANRAAAALLDQCHASLSDFLGDRKAGIRNQLILTLVLSLAIFAAACLLGTSLSRSITRPLAAIARSVERLGRSETDQPVEESDRTDELGPIAAALENWRLSLIEGARRREVEASETKARLERSQRLETRIRRFNDDISISVETTSAAAAQLEATSQSMRETAEYTTTFQPA